MPFDGTHYDETTEQLKLAKDILITQGWCRGARVNWKGEHCALGVLDVIMGRYVTFEDVAVQRLAASIPWSDRAFGGYGYGADSNIALYNNLQTDIKPILDWFDRAIG